MFKKALFLTTILIIFSCNKTENQKKKELIIEGKIKNLTDNTYVILQRINNYSSKIIDSSYSKKQYFSLRVKDYQKFKGIYSLIFKNNKDSVLFFRDLWVEKNNLTLYGNFNKKKSIKVLNDSINSFLNRELPNKYNNKIEEFFKNEKDPSKIQSFFKKIESSIRQDQIKYLFLNPNNPFSVSEITNFKDIISKDSMLLFYNTLDKKFQKSKAGLNIKGYTVKNQIRIGNKFIDFESKDINGNKIKISDFKGKIILLDFWAYWCSWCHVQNKKEFSYLKETYKDDLVIISYSLDEEKNKWIKSTKEDNITWVNISNLKGTKDPIAFSYKVRELPHSFLINKKGIVVKQFVGYHRDSLIEKEIKKMLH
jgi:peroxiredoxin